MSTPVLFSITTPTGPVAGVPAYAPADPDAPFLAVMDLAVTRGDGIFETASVIDGHIQALAPHLARFVNSAAIMDLPTPDLGVWEEAIRAAVSAHDGGHERYVKFIMTRGVEGTGIPTAWAYVDDAEDFSGERTDGIAVVTLSRGYRHDIVETSPWLLQGAKTLSYAVHKSMLREAARRGADDVIMTATDGFVLEGPTSNVVIRIGNTILTPQTDQGILKGTTQASVFAFFESQGFETVYGLVPTEKLAEADAIWLVSSVRQAAPVHSIDGAPVVVDSAVTARLNAALLGRVE